MSNGNDSAEANLVKLDQLLGFERKTFTTQTARADSFQGGISQNFPFGDLNVTGGGTFTGEEFAGDRFDQPKGVFDEKVGGFKLSTILILSIIGGGLWFLMKKTK